MIKIMTKDGISLDLAPDAEFAIEYNNPMFEDDRIPVPFSTSIALLPSATNCRVLQYLPALKLEPAVKKLVASLVLNGIPFLTGTLIYDGIEDGRLNYSFAGRDIADTWGMKLYELDIPRAIIGNDGTARSNGVSYPIVTSRNFTGYFVEGDDSIAVTREYNNNFAPKTSRYQKYRNFYPRYKIPAVEVQAILSERLGTFSDDINEMLPYIAVLAPFKINEFSLGSQNESVAMHLPNISLCDFIKEFLKLFCAAVYMDEDNLVVKSFNDMTQTYVTDWTSKISDSFNSENEEANGYVFGYANSDEDAANLDMSSLAEVDALASALYVSVGLIAGSPLVVDIPVKVKSTGDYVSNKSSFVESYVKYRVRPPVAERKWRLIAADDVLFHNNLKQQNNVDGADIQDNSSDFNLVKCVPSILNEGVKQDISDGSYTGPSSERPYVMVSRDPKFSLTPIIDFVNEEAERSSDVHIGLVYKDQMTDSGHVMPEKVPEVSVSNNNVSVDGDVSDVLLIPEGSTEPISLRPDWLYEHFHKSYAQWLATDRQVISCDVNLNEFDLLNFRMYNKVRLHGRDFFVKKLSVTLRAGSEALECSADFISA